MMYSTLFFVACLVSVKAFDYCTINCGGHKHLMCQYPAGGGAACSGYKGGLTPYERQVILAQHNLVRQRVAKGEEKRGSQPPAADMTELTWDDELALIAQRWVDQCKEQGMASCGTTKNQEYVGQNMFTYMTQGQQMSKEQVLKYAVTFWSQGVGKFSHSLIKKFEVANNFMETGSYSQLAWATTKRLGCGMSMKKDGYQTDYKVICNYQPGGNMPTVRMYKVGKACSACPKGLVCSKKYPGLCTKG